MHQRTRTLTTSAVAVVFFAVARFGFELAPHYPSATTVWPAAGVGLDALLVCGFHVWPGLLLGAFAASVVSISGPSAIGVAGACSVDALSGAYLLKRYAPSASLLVRPVHVGQFSLVALVVGLTNGTLAVTAMLASGRVQWSDYGATWLALSLAAAVGVLVLAPPVVLWATDARRWSSRRVVEGLALLALTLFVSVLVAAVVPPNRPASFLLFPVVMLAAFRFGPAETATVSSLISTVVIAGALRGVGPFPSALASPSPILLEAFCIVNATAALTLALVIAEREHTEQQLSTREHGFRAIFEQAHVGVAQVDTRTGRFVRVNQSYCDLVGRSRDEMAATTFMALTHPDDRAENLRNMEALVGGRIRHFSMEKRYPRPDGTIAWVDLTVSPLWVPEGEARYHVDVVSDITPRKRADESLRLALEAAPTGMIMVDEGGRIVRANSQVDALFGYPRNELIGEPIDTLVPARFRAGHPEYRRLFCEAPEARPMGAGKDLFGLRRDGTEVPIEIGLNPIETSEGRFVLGSIVDITERQRADSERAQLLAELRHLTADLERRVAERTHDARENEARYRALFDESPISLVEGDLTHTKALLEAESEDEFRAALPRLVDELGLKHYRDRRILRRSISPSMPVSWGMSC